MKRIAIINKERCHPDKCGNYWCIGACPVNRTGKECIIKSEDQKVAIIEEACIGCGICLKCPFDAIQIVNLPEKLKQDPLHRFGQNMFELFSLPIPKENTVVGIIGRNGIGKSTALQIFANQIIPNLGNYNKETEKDKIIQKYSKSFLGDYFKKIYNNKIKISYKPQRIELLPKIYKGKVSDLIKKIDEKNISQELIKELELQNIINRNINELSGGELQRIAILASLIKKADLIILDEPCAFLDIPQRIKVAKLIRLLAKNTSVLIVEHDLAILDYISDEIQIFYGEQAAYGIVSQSKTVKRGINEYLNGFLPDDNVRFRNYPIKFTRLHEDRSTEQQTLLVYPKITKSFKDFKLEISPGQVKKKQILGIMGQNGLGKSTFLKILAGQLSTNKKIEKLSISLKPQQLPLFKGTVKEFLKQDNPSYNSSHFKSNMEKLNLSKLKNNNVNELSGGELQKVHILKCLSHNTKIFALDEPSAFIDIEDRLNVAQVIKDFVKQKDICALVVDHDFQFMDYLADTILIFEGTPGKQGNIKTPLKKQEGMNKFLKILDITYREDQETGRARINKPGSQKDIQQKKENIYYEL